MYRSKGYEHNTKQDFSFTEDRCQGTTSYFTLSGRVFLHEATYMEQMLERAINTGTTHIVINMCMVHAFSSAGIRVVLSAYKKLKSEGGTLQIENPSENVINIMGMTALDELLVKHTEGN